MPARRRRRPVPEAASIPGATRGSTAMVGSETAIGLGQRYAFVGLLEAAEDRIATGHGAIHGILDRGLAGEDLLEGVRDLLTDLDEAAKADAAGVARIAGDRQAGNRGLAALVRRLVVEAVGLHVVETGLGDRDIAGDGRPEQRLLGLGDEVEEGGSGLVFLRLVAFQHPERGAAD